MSKEKQGLSNDFPILLKEIKNRIQQAQSRAVLAVNAELVQLYWNIGRIIAARQQQEGWGAAVIPRLSRELLNELPEVKGFSERNVKSMLAFYRQYPDPSEFVQQAAAQLQRRPISPQPVAKIRKAGKVPQPAAQLHESVLWSIPWYHHVVLMEKVKDRATRLWYMQQTLTNGWSRNAKLVMMRELLTARIRLDERESAHRMERIVAGRIPQMDLWLRQCRRWCAGHWSE